jgi:hypothetical protein
VDLTPRRTSVAGADRRWNLDRHGLDSTAPVVLNGDLFTGDVVKSGTVIGIVTATNLAGPYAGRTSEVQTIDLGAATAGTITIGFDGETTGAIAFNATAAAVQTALEGLSNVDPGDITVTGGPLPGTITLTFGGRYTGVDVPQVVVTPTGLTGGTVTVATTTAGGSAVTDGRQRAVGFLVNDEVRKAGGRVAAAVKNHGAVDANFLPVASGPGALDAAARADLTHVRFRG